MRRTVRWAHAAYAHYLRREKSQYSALFPIVQGSMFADLRSACAEELLALNAPGYAIGGLSVGEPRDLSQEMAAHTAPLLPKDRPRYVMGVGMPEELPQYVKHGVDMMDCVLPSRNARYGSLFTSQGKVAIKQARYTEDEGPLDPACPCYTCRTFTRAYLRHLFQAGEILFSTLATLHNLHYFLDIMRQIRQAILLGNFSAWLRSFEARQAVSE
jgi:queuine tRNA-ribosyltransferase